MLDTELLISSPSLMEEFIPRTRQVEVEFDPFAGPPIQRTVPTTES